ncbi:hypothetical protein DB30_07795 [Enhygromyxa salina]|uniref:Uncharacterized protein n=2 Tax=Enhygromyxa salina TaxID=215803 RepID=A0A0C2DBI3_9BACT|nr:hypothetical protein DB30_07795 [Enhygromyxa salina]
MGLVFTIVGMGLVIASARASVLELYPAISPETGEILDRIPRDQLASASAWAYAEFRDGIFAVVALGWGCAITVWVGLRQHDRVTGSQLRRVAAPLLVPVVALLAAATVVDSRFENFLAPLLEWFTDQPPRFFGECMKYLSGCSHMRGFELVRGAALAACALAAGLLLPAGHAAWRAGLRGWRAPRGVSAAAIVCFVLGSLVFVTTRLPREDLRESIVRCQHSADLYASAIQATNQFTVHTSPLELHARSIEELDDRYIWRYLDATGTTHGDELGLAEVFASGEVRAFLSPWWSAHEADPTGKVGMSDAALAAALREAVETFDDDTRGTWNDDEPPPPIVRPLHLYVDERVSLARMTQVLELLHDAGVTDVILVGVVRVDASLPSVGAWHRDYYQAYGRLELRGGDWQLDDFASWSALSDLAAAYGVAGVALSG